MNSARGSRPGNKLAARLLQRDPYLRVDGEELRLAKVVRVVGHVVVVVVVVVEERRVAVLVVVQRTRDVELLVDYLPTEGQSVSSKLGRSETRCLLPDVAGLCWLTEMRKNTMQVREKPLV